MSLPSSSTEQREPSGAACGSRVRVEPSGIVIDVAPGESLIEAAWRQKYYWPTICGGRQECTACVSAVLSGGDTAEPPDELETTLLARVSKRLGDEEDRRLACCFRPGGDAVVIKKGVRPNLDD